MREVAEQGHVMFKGCILSHEWQIADPECRAAQAGRPKTPKCSAPCAQDLLTRSVCSAMGLILGMIVPRSVTQHPSGQPQLTWQGLVNAMHAWRMGANRTDALELTHMDTLLM